MSEAKDITVTLEGHAVDFIEQLSARTGTPVNDVVSAIVNGYRVGEKRH